MLRYGAPDKIVALAGAAGGARPGRGEDRAEIGVLASIGSGLGADVGDLHGVGLEPRPGDDEGARQREGLGLLGAQLAQRVRGAEILLLASGTVERDARALGGLESGGVAGGAGRTGEHASRHHGVEIVGAGEAKRENGEYQERTSGNGHLSLFGSGGGPLTIGGAPYFKGIAAVGPTACPQAHVPRIARASDRVYEDAPTVQPASFRPGVAASGPGTPGVPM